MIRAEVVDAISAKTGQLKKDVIAMLDAQDEVIVQALKAEGGLYPLGKSGRVELVRREARSGRNPATGATIEVPAKNSAKFKPSKDLLAALV